MGFIHFRGRPENSKVEETNWSWGFPHSTERIIPGILYSDVLEWEEAITRCPDIRLVNCFIIPRLPLIVLCQDWWCRIRETLGITAVRITKLVRLVCWLSGGYVVVQGRVVDSKLRWIKRECYCSKNNLFELCNKIELLKVHAFTSSLFFFYWKSSKKFLWKVWTKPQQSVKVLQDNCLQYIAWLQAGRDGCQTYNRRTSFGDCSVLSAHPRKKIVWPHQLYQNLLARFLYVVVGCFWLLGNPKLLVATKQLSKSWCVCVRASVHWRIDLKINLKDQSILQFEIDFIFKTKACIQLFVTGILREMFIVCGR